ncbi:TolC family outer membrane protein [Marinobacter sp.]|uniref:TolC family outer membrane protein n=1 Tax=Marinobacter sp. TaxID=50741 RepID=UPI003A8CFE06
MNKIIPTAKILAACCFGLLPVSNVVAFSEQADDLLSVVQETLETNPEIEARLQAFEASTYDRREVFGGYLPSIDASASAGGADREFDNRGAYSRNYAEISITQMLFDGFRVRSAVDEAEHTSRARYYELLNELETKALEASEAYLSVKRHRELVTQAQKNVANHLRVQQHVSDRAERGVSNQADLKQINGRLSLARSNLMTEIANLQSVTARFQRLVGRYPAEHLRDFDVPDERVPERLEAVLESVYANNPELFAAFENIQSADASFEGAKAGRYPVIELGASHGVYKNNNSFDTRTDPRSFGNESIIELRARYNLYRGGSDRAAERAAYRRINQAESLRDKVCVDLRQTASIAHSDVQNLKIKLKSLEAHRNDAEGVLAAYRQQFDIGRRSLLDVLDSENEFFQAERAYVSGKYDLYIQQLRTLHSMGRLIEALSLSRTEMPDLAETNGSVGPGASRYCAAVPGDALGMGRYLQAVTADETLDLSGDALFDVGSSEFKPEAAARLGRFAQRVLEQGAPRSIRIVGHTDNTGSDAMNRELSLARAKAVRDALIVSGIDETLMVVSGVGSDQPVASNQTAEGRSLNRRVEIRVIRAR